MMPESTHDRRKCMALFDKLSEYIDNELDPSTSGKIEKHLRRCNPCQACLETLRRTVSLCRELEPAAMPEDLALHLREMVNKAIGRK